MRERKRERQRVGERDRESVWERERDSKYLILGLDLAAKAELIRPV